MVGVHAGYWDGTPRSAPPLLVWPPPPLCSLNIARITHMVRFTDILHRLEEEVCDRTKGSCHSRSSTRNSISFMALFYDINRPMFFAFIAPSKLQEPHVLFVFKNALNYNAWCRNDPCRQFILLAKRKSIISSSTSQVLHHIITIICCLWFK